MKKIEIAILIGIGCLAIILYSFLNLNPPAWDIEILDLPNIVERNPLTVQEGIKKAVILNEFEIRVAAFQIRDPKGGFIPDPIARAWYQKGLIQGFSTGFEGKDLYFRFNEKRVEIWTSADKFFTVEGGKVIVRLLNDDGQIVAEATTEINIYHTPLKVDEIYWIVN
jgi:hypothetical protein